MLKIKAQIIHKRIKFYQWIILMNNNIKEKIRNNFVITGIYLNFT